MNKMEIGDIDIDLGVELKDYEKFITFYNLLINWNQKINLTAITEHREVFLKHFYDSLLIRNLSEWKTIVTAHGSVIDIGTGAGFPGIPLAICFPDVSFVLCDALQKRLFFLHEVIEELHLKNVELIHGRAEDIARNSKYRQKFDGVLSRAVAKLNVLVELMCPFSKIGGYSFAYKGPHVDDEMIDGKRAAGQVGSEMIRISKYLLSQEYGDRSIVVFRQRHQTASIFPRKAGVPQKKPL